MEDYEKILQELEWSRKVGNNRRKSHKEGRFDICPEIRVEYLEFTHEWENES